MPDFLSGAYYTNDTKKQYLKLAPGRGGNEVPFIYADQDYHGPVKITCQLSTRPVENWQWPRKKLQSAIVSAGTDRTTSSRCGIYVFDAKREFRC
jgi:hypothetical protein